MFLRERSFTNCLLASPLSIVRGSACYSGEIGSIRSSGMHRCNVLLFLLSWLHKETNARIEALCLRTRAQDRFLKRHRVACWDRACFASKWMGCLSIQGTKPAMHDDARTSSRMRLLFRSSRSDSTISGVAGRVRATPRCCSRHTSLVPSQDEILTNLR